MKSNIPKKQILTFMLIFIISFILQFSLNWYESVTSYEKCINGEYNEIAAEIILEATDNYSTSYKLDHSIKGGLLLGFLVTSFSLTVYIIYKLITSKSINKVIAGYSLLVILIIGIVIYTWFINNFTLVF